jgi:hypothetical protein
LKEQGWQHGVATTEKLLIPASFGPVAQHHEKHPHSFAEAPPRQLHRLYRLHRLHRLHRQGQNNMHGMLLHAHYGTDMHANSRRMNA